VVVIPGFAEALFEYVTGEKPENDDIERSSCVDAGTLGHHQCGWCPSHSRPRFQCGCATNIPTTSVAEIVKLLKIEEALLA